MTTIKQIANAGAILMTFGMAGSGVFACGFAVMGDPNMSTAATLFNVLCVGTGLGFLMFFIAYLVLRVAGVK